VVISEEVVRFNQFCLTVLECIILHPLRDIWKELGKELCTLFLTYVPTFFKVDITSVLDKPIKQRVVDVSP
jgi:hypothetical protein